ncbi:hypothetical protein D9M70_545680 [compost metagenome]
MALFPGQFTEFHYFKLIGLKKGLQLFAKKAVPLIGKFFHLVQKGFLECVLAQAGIIQPGFPEIEIIIQAAYPHRQKLIEVGTRYGQEF